jgi:hypothetical protein
MEFKPLDNGTKRSSSSLRHLDFDSYEKSIITKEQFEEIKAYNLAKDERYGTALKNIHELNER